MSTDDHLALVADIRRLVRWRLLDPLGELLSDATGSVAVVAAAADVQAEVWAAQLLDGEPSTARRTAARLASALFGDDDPPRSWWTTPLGRVVASRVGHPGAESVTAATAAAILGISRQGVADLVRRGRLATDRDGGVLSASIADRLSAADTPRRPLVRTD